MPVTVEGTPTLSSLAVASSVTFSHTTGSTAKGLFVGGWNDTATATSTATFNGDSLTELWDLGSTGVIRSAGYLMVVPDIATANVVLTWAASTTGMAGAVGLADLETSSVAAAHRTVYTASNGASGPTVTVVDSQSGDLVIDAAGLFGTSIAVGGGQTSRVESDNPGGTSRSWGISTESATGASTVMSWTGDATNVIGATALIAAAAAYTPAAGALTLAGIASALRYQINMPDEL